MSDWTVDAEHVFLDKREALRFLGVTPEWFNINAPKKAARISSRGGPNLYRLADLLPVLANQARLRIKHGGRHSMDTRANSDTDRAGGLGGSE